MVDMEWLDVHDDVIRLADLHLNSRFSISTENIYTYECKNSVRLCMGGGAVVQCSHSKTQE